MEVNWSAVSVITNVAIVLLGGLAWKWFSGVLDGVKGQITIAILTLRNELNDRYATRPELGELREDMRREIDLAERIDSAPEKTAQLLARRGFVNQSGSGGVVPRA